MNKSQSSSLFSVLLVGSGYNHLGCLSLSVIYPFLEQFVNFGGGFCFRVHFLRVGWYEFSI